MINIDRQKEEKMQKTENGGKAETTENSGITEGRPGKKRRGMPCGILLSLMLLVCLCGLCRNPVTVRADEIVESEPQIADLSDTSGALLPKAGKPSGVSLADLYDESENWYGSQLTDAEKTIYSAIVAHNDDMGNYSVTSSTESGTTTYKIENGFSIDASSLNLTVDDTASIVRATHAYIRDYGEMYWVTSFIYGYSYYKDSGEIISITLAPVDYYSGVREDIGATDAVLAAAAQEIAGYSTDYEKIEAAHDYVVDLITYGNNDLERAHTITGGLLEKYGHTAVCECYAKLFRLLCTRNGISCILITGGSSTDADTGKVVADHMWNYVQLDGAWYLMDCTWDDTASTEVYFLAGSGTTVLNNTTAAKDHMAVGVFGTTSYTTFSVPTLSSSAYVSRVEKITLDQTTLTLDVGNTGTIKATALPANAEKGKTIDYKSSNTAVATVDDSGEITAVGVGTAEITAYSGEYPSVKAVCTVTVREHEWVEEEVLTAATCTEEGESKLKCSHTGCSETKTETVPATGHSYGDWTITSVPETGKDGEKIRYCQNTGCSKSETRKFFSINRTAVTLDVGNTISITATGGSVADEKGNSTLT